MKGDESQLLNAARSGQVLSNDLVYDANAAQWSFARSLSVLRGFPLRNRTSSEDVDDADSRVIETGRRLLARRQTVGRLLRALGVLIFLMLLTVILFLIPDSKKRAPKKNLDNVLGFDDRAMKIEGSGSGMSETENTRKGSSNMDAKRVVVEGEQDNDLQTEGGGRKAALLLTPEEIAQLNQSGANQASAAADASENTATEMPNEKQQTIDSSPSISAAPPPTKVTPNGETKEQPLVLIRPRLDQLQTKVDALSTSKDEMSKESVVESATKELSSIEKQVNEGDYGSKGSELREMINQIRSKLEEGCDELDAPEKCRLRIKHPGWSSVALDAVERKDVILGMTPSQVEASIGEPTERRESGKEAVWCYDEKCEQRIEFTRGRVMTVTEGVVTSGTEIETGDEDLE